MSDDMSITHFFKNKRAPAPVTETASADSASADSASAPEPLQEFTQGMHPGWRALLAAELRAPEFAALAARVASERARMFPTILPAPSQVFAAFGQDPRNVKVLILGQNPYISPGQPSGFAFATAAEPPPPSLANVVREITSDVGSCADPTLLSLPAQGVMLLNSSLTVIRGQCDSHLDIGWQHFTDAVVRRLSAKQPLVVMLWGRVAKDKKALIDTPARHFILQAAHPSPKSADSGFFGCKHFSQANVWLRIRGKQPVVW